MAPSANHTSILGSSGTDFIKIIQPAPRLTRTKKSVSWAPKALAYSIPHVNDMLEEEINAVWYGRKDYKAFKNDCKASAILAREGRLLDSNSPMIASFCARGLEQIVDKQVGSLRRFQRNNMWCIVLEEQREQLTTGIYDPESYQELCYEISAMAQSQAHIKATRDCEEVLQQKAKEDRKQQAALSKKQISSKRCALRPAAGAPGSLKRRPKHR